MSAAAPPPLPEVDHELHRPFWEGTRAGELRVQVCGDCGTRQWPPRWRCPECGRGGLAWEAVPARGRLYSWVVAHHAFLPALVGRVPYVVGIVELVGVPRIRFLGTIVGVADRALEPEMLLEAVFEVVTPEVTLVNWRPAA